MKQNTILHKCQEFLSDYNQSVGHYKPSNAGRARTKSITNQELQITRNVGASLVGALFVTYPTPPW